MTISIFIDGKKETVEKGEYLLTALRRLGKRVPALCYHPALKKPVGACRLCTVEIQLGEKPPKIQRSCIARTRPGMMIITKSDVIRAARSRAMNALLAYAPQSEVLHKIAGEFGFDTKLSPDGCIRCHLCYRVCTELVGAGALKPEHRDGHLYIVPVPGHCIGCGTCANVCPTKAIKILDHDGIRTISIRDEVIGQHALERCEGCGRLYATSKFLSHIQQRTDPGHPDVKEHHRYCPVCAKLFSDRMRRLM
jgi:NADH dehydrogenase/NADH:ubiquinone oxidoreductase subunit G